MDERLRFAAFPLDGHDRCLSAIVRRDAMPHWGRGLALSVLDCWVPECPPYGARRDFQPKQEFRPMNKSLSDLRIDAFVRQAGRCYYCTVLMWIDDGVSFARKHGLSSRVGRWLKCTAEHLLARRDGGRDSRDNIVAACLFCNLRRHRGRTKAPTPRA